MNRIARMTTFGVISLALGLGPVARGDAQEEERLRVVTTLSVLKDIAEEVGGERVVVESLSDPRQDPHYVQPRPTLMKRTREADLFIEIGLELEIWAQKVVDGSANPRIQMGQKGRILASEGVSTLELPENVSREWGDVHPYGNPHIWLDPINVRRMAENIATGLQQVDPAHRDEYARRLAAYQEKLDTALFGEDLVQALGGQKLARLAQQGRLMDYLERKGLGDKIGGWMKKAEGIRGKKVVTYHKTWVYFASRFGLTTPIEIEENPGISPSARHRERVIRTMEEDEIPAIVQSSYYDRTAADYIAEKTDAKVVIVPIDVGAVETVTDYFGFMTYLIDTITAGIAGS